MSVIGWFKRRQTPSAKAVMDFTGVAKAQGMPLDYGNDKRLADLLNSNDDPARNMDEIAKLLGQSGSAPER